MTCSTTSPPVCSSSYGPGVAETKTTWLIFCFPLVELQRPVVERAGQPEAVLDQRRLAAVVAGEHAAHLRHRDVRLVDEQQVIVGKEIEQRVGVAPGGRPLSGRL